MYVSGYVLVVFLLCFYVCQKRFPMSSPYIYIYIAICSTGVLILLSTGFIVLFHIRSVYLISFVSLVVRHPQRLGNAGKRLVDMQESVWKTQDVMGDN